MFVLVIEQLCDSQDEVNQTISSGVTSAGRSFCQCFIFHILHTGCQHQLQLHSLFFVDDDIDELEEELKSLLEESKPDSISGLPQVPGRDLPSCLPAVPHSHLPTTTEELEEELSQLTLIDPGLHFVLLCTFSLLHCNISV